MSEFIHLHTHTEYSLLDGAIRIKDLCQRAKDLGMPAVAITDHGNMFGAVIFYQMAKDMGLKPIIGCEVYVAPGDEDQENAHHIKEGKSGGYHLVLLAMNQHGYRNLIELVTQGFLEGFHYKPRVCKNLLKRYNEGLIALSACLGGEVPRTLRSQGLDAGVAMARTYADIFPGRFYLELQDNGLKEQNELNELLIACARETGLPLVATNDCHYLTREDYEAHDLLLCVQTQAVETDANRMRMETDQLYFKTPEEMEQAFAHVPEAIANTQAIAERCNLIIETGNYYFPVYQLEKADSIDEEFVRLAREGLERRIKTAPYPIDEAKYRERLEYELDVILQMGFPAYFLIVQDFINWAKNNRIPVGPGRGSAAGSIVAWSLKITNLDPIPYDLLFERFLNVERVSMPDIDVDFCERRRHEVIRYVSRKYGHDHVSQITTFGTMKAKAVVRDVGRAMGMAFAETDKIAKLIPEDLKMTIDKALEQEPELRNLVDLDPRLGRLIDISRRLEGLCRHASTHAAGVVISDKPMTHYLPLYKGKKDEIVSQYDMKRVEKVGLIKFDFLGLRTMTVIEDCLDIIRDQGKEAPDLDTLALTDEATYRVFITGDTDGVFQVESSGMRKYLQMLKPNCFEDIIAMLALYRPGPLGSGMVDEFIKRKHGEIPVTYLHPSLEDTLKPTYGVIVYQEQVMACARIIANYSLGEGDLLRRAMGKKIAEEMAKHRARFLEGARENKIDEKTANDIFDLMEQFAAYGFNKSHSAAYALISYFTAYLKAHFPVEFMAALITSELSNTDKVYTYINACREMDIEVVPPNVNVSRRNFTVHEGKVVFGLGGVKNVGDEAVNEIVREREQNGPYEGLADFCCRVNLRKVTKRVIEYLIKSGAMDGFGCSRAGLLASMDKAVSYGQKQAKEKQAGMISMLDMLGGPAKGGDEAAPTGGAQCLNLEELTCEEMDDRERLRLEKEAIGFYISDHPLMGYRREMARMRLFTLEDVKEMSAGAEVKVALVNAGFQEKITKNGNKMGICQVEDLTGTGELVIFPKALPEAKPFFLEDRALLITGKVSEQETFGGEDAHKKAKLILEHVEYLSDATAGNMADVPLELREEDCTEDRLRSLQGIMLENKGNCRVLLRIERPDCMCTLQVGEDFAITTSPQFWKSFEKWRRGVL